MQGTMYNQMFPLSWSCSHRRQVSQWAFNHMYPWSTWPNNSLNQGMEGAVGGWGLPLREKNPSTARRRIQEVEAQLRGLLVQRQRMG